MPGSVKRRDGSIRFRTILPQLLTASRVALAAAALIAALEGRLYWSATLIVMGAVSDGLDGLLSRRLASAIPFGALFDYFADYLCFVVTPWILMRAILSGQQNLLQEAMIGLPLVTGAIRYARNGLVVIGQTGGTVDLPGLGTIYFAFLCVTTVFLDARALMGQDWLLSILPCVVVVFSLLMLAPIQYPKLTRFPGVLPLVLVLLALMPFFETRILSSAILVLGMLFAIIAPFFRRR